CGSVRRAGVHRRHARGVPRRRRTERRGDPDGWPRPRMWPVRRRAVRVGCAGIPHKRRLLDRAGDVPNRNRHVYALPRAWLALEPSPPHQRPRRASILVGFLRLRDRRSDVTPDGRPGLEPALVLWRLTHGLGATADGAQLLVLVGGECDHPCPLLVVPLRLALGDGLEGAAVGVVLVAGDLGWLPAVESLVGNPESSGRPQFSDEPGVLREAAREKGTLTSPRFRLNTALQKSEYCRSVMSSASGPHSASASNSIGSPAWSVTATTDLGMTSSKKVSIFAPNCLSASDASLPALWRAWIATHSERGSARSRKRPTASRMAPSSWRTCSANLFASPAPPMVWAGVLRASASAFSAASQSACSAASVQSSTVRSGRLMRIGTGTPHGCH